MSPEIISAIFTLLGFIIIMYALFKFIRYREFKKYNSGLCPICHSGIFRSFDMASDLSTGYRCTRCHHTIWLNYGFPEEEFMRTKKTHKVIRTKNNTFLLTKDLLILWIWNNNGTNKTSTKYKMPEALNVMKRLLSEKEYIDMQKWLFEQV